MMKEIMCKLRLKKNFLIDYLAARNLSLRLIYYRQRVEHVEEVESSEYAGLESYQEERDQGQFELRVNSLMMFMEEVGLPFVYGELI